MTGKPALDKVLILINLVLMLASAGMVVYSHMGIKKLPTDQAGELDKLKSGVVTQSQVTPFKVKKMTINLDSRSSRLRYLDMEMFLLPFEESQKPILENIETRIMDMVIELASAMAPEDLNTLTGKMLLESRIKTRINDYLKEPVVKSIFFAKFIVQ